MDWRVLSVGAVAASLLSLVVWSVPAYDPTAWLIWGRQLGEGTLSMIGGPSWKPLPVAFTTVFAFAGDTVAPWLWLVVARLSGFAALGVAYLLARRLGGHRAGLFAVAGLALATDFLFNCLRGDSEGFLVAFALGAVLLHLEGRRWPAFTSAILASCVRPEVWPLLAAYGLWLAWHERRFVTLAVVGAGGAFVLAVWLVPDYVATGEWFRGAERAQNPVDGSPGQSAFPFGFSIALGALFLPWFMYAGAAVAISRSRRARPRTEVDRTVLHMALGAAALWVIIGLMAESGFTGNIRYSTLPGATMCVVGAVGIERFVELVRARLRPRAAYAVGVLALLAAIVSAGIVVNGGTRLVREDRVMGTALDEAIALAGGEQHIRSCGRVATTAFERQMVSWQLHMRQRDVYTHAEAPGIMFVRRGEIGKAAHLLPIRAQTDDWIIRSTCPLP